ncbi:50S ribosomal protein L3 [Candidatus Micrarchaeota archaeon]|nr:50S ribosomal protein L3 [Candidatus Micrarchaeota archaeon]
MAYRPRKRASKQNARVHWQDSEEGRPLGFAGYKAGMMHVAYVDESNSPTKGQEVVSSATVLEVPPLTVYGARCYSSKNSSGDILTEDEKILKKAGMKKKPKAPQVSGEDIDDIRLLVYADPSRTSFAKKHIEKMEIGCGGKDPKEKLEFCKGLLGKELKIGEVFKSGDHVDVIAVTKGKGWQGPVKRFGVSVQRRKATNKRRHVGTLGPFRPAYIMYTAPQAGQTGYHKRTEINKMVMKIGDKPEEVNPSCGFPRYGFVKGDYVVLKGSVPGPAKRMVKLRLSVRRPPAKEQPLTFLSNERVVG